MPSMLSNKRKSRDSSKISKERSKNSRPKSKETAINSMKGFKSRTERHGKKAKTLIQGRKDKTQGHDHALEVKLTKKNHKNKPIRT